MTPSRTARPAGDQSGPRPRPNYPYAAMPWGRYAKSRTSQTFSHDCAAHVRPARAGAGYRGGECRLCRGCQPRQSRHGSRRPGSRPPGWPGVRPGGRPYRRCRARAVRRAVAGSHPRLGRQRSRPGRRPGRRAVEPAGTAADPLAAGRAGPGPRVRDRRTGRGRRSRRGLAGGLAAGWRTPRWRRSPAAGPGLAGRGQGSDRAGHPRPASAGSRHRSPALRPQPQPPPGPGRDRAPL